METRGGDKRPMLSDLRESGAIEQDADIVSFIYRPEYYGFDNIDGEDVTGTGEIMIAKHRNGSLGNVRLRFVGKFAKFENLESFGEPLDFEPGQNRAAAIASFESTPSYTLKSKMDEDTDGFSFDNSGMTDENPF